MFYTFTRSWYTWGKCPRTGRRIPVMPRRMPRKHRTGRVYDREEDARAACREYNATHDPGPLSHKMEYAHV